MASNDWVCGKLKLSEYAVPTDFTAKMDTTSTAIHRRTTMRR